MARAVGLFCAALLVCNSAALKQGSTDYEDASFWMKSGQKNLQKVLAYRNNEKQAKNVVIFVGDGMGLASVTAGRIYTGQRYGMSGEEYSLIFEQFPSTGLSKTYNVDRQVPDSAGTATAMFSGVKCRMRVIGFDGKAPYNHCDKEINDKSKLTTIADWAQASGLDTGFVTTTRVTHATPAGLYAHINNRDWECESSIPHEYRECTKDIARQLVEDVPGSRFKVVMGGGGQMLGIPMPSRTLDKSVCSRGDDLNLADVWIKNNPAGKVVTTKDELMSVDIANTSKIMGIFATSHLPYHDVRPDDVPTLANMTTQALRFLKKNKKGFILMVESGKIDIAHHKNYAKLALREVQELEEAVKATLREVNLDETLIIVTADHSHSFTMNGYPERGNDILGYSQNPYDAAIAPYETLSYANGPGFLYHWVNNSIAANKPWRPVENDPERKKTYYQNMAAMYLADDTHGGEDVAVYAIGPYSHLFRGTFEQNYIAHVVAYAACFRDWPSHCDRAYSRYYYELTNSAVGIAAPSYVLLTALILGLVVGRL